MRRGVVTFSSHELTELKNSITWSTLPNSLSERLKDTPVPENREDIRIFLSEEDAEYVLDAIDPDIISKSEVGRSANIKLREFLISLRET